jgi:hypothetical protein
MLNDYRIEYSIVFAIDWELVLLNLLDDAFPNVLIVLCIWHIQKNVENNTKKHFSKPLKGIDGFYLKY